MLRQAACGFGTLGLAALLADNRLLAMPEAPGADALRKPHFPAKAKRVIFLFMHGGPSSIDTFDYKPKLAEYNDKPLPFKRPLTFAEGRVGNLNISPPSCSARMQRLSYRYFP